MPQTVGATVERLYLYARFALFIYQFLAPTFLHVDINRQLQIEHAGNRCGRFLVACHVEEKA